MAAQVNLEIEKRLIFLQCANIGDVEMRGVQKVKLALEIKIQKSMDGLMRRNDAAGDGSFFGCFLHFDPMFVAADSRAFRRDGKRKAMRRSGILAAVSGAGVRDVVGSERTKRLAIVFGNGNVQANLVEADFHAFIGIVANRRVNGDDAVDERRLFWEAALIGGGVGPRLRGNRDAFMGLDGGGAHGGLPGRAGGEGDSRYSGEKGKQHERVSHRVIIALSHLDAFDSQGKCKVARRARHLMAGVRKKKAETHFVYFIYSLLMGVAALALTPYWVVQGLRRGKYLSNLGERLGFSFPALEGLPANRAGAIWIHAVSVGEALSAVTLARRLKDKYPGRPLIISTTTLTGQALAKERMGFADAVFYFPFDWAFCVRRALRAVQPAMVIVLETEIWPNFLREARRRNVPVVFVSGRVSDRSFARYRKWLGIFGFFLRPFLQKSLADASMFLMQSEKDAERIRALGAPAERVQTSGNLKYDLERPAATPISAWLAAEARRCGRSPVIVAGSVVATEEPLALIAFGTLQGEHRKALLVLAPRKPECFESAAEFIAESHRKFLRRSQLPIPRPSQDGKTPVDFAIPEDVTVLLLDSIGELASLYGVADGAFVGGSLVPSGGHNILEPAAFGKIPVFGPSMENFSEVASRFVAAGAAIQVESPEDAGVAWIELLRNPERAARMGEAARGLVESSRGATDRAIAEVARRLDGATR